MLISTEEKTIFCSPCSKDIFCYSPSILSLSDGSLLVSFDLGGPGTVRLPGARSHSGDYQSGNQCKIFMSVDHGMSWHHMTDLPLLHARLFQAGEVLYLIGHNGNLCISRSLDRGESWSEISVLDDQHRWHQAPCAIDHRHGKVYLTMEQGLEGVSWPGVAPVLMSGCCNADLLQKENWSFSNPLVFSSEVGLSDAAGIPFYKTGILAPGNPRDVRFCGDPCWLESHVVRVYDTKHIFYDPQDRTVLLWMRLHSGMTNLAAIAQGVEEPEGSLSLSLLRTPAGSKLVFVPCPGGQMKFHILYDSVSSLYWLLSSQSTDSMTRPDLLPSDRYGLPDNERNRMQLHFSKNLFDWCFAGMVALGKTSLESRHYGCMVIDGDSLQIVSRSGDSGALSAHNTNMITFHSISDFRRLIY